ncbi:hypothetical protein JW877_10690 [bacterium]|nr:hypothetical protein [bacterium]
MFPNHSEVRRYFRKLILIIILLGSMITSGLTAEKQVFYHYSRSYSLPDSFIIVNSESLFCGTRLLNPKDDYEMDYLRGRIQLQSGLECDSLVVYYGKLILNLPLKVWHRIPVTGEGGVTFVMEKEKPVFGEWTKFSHSGSIMRGIKIGTNRDLALDSGFELEAAGSIGDQVNIAAVLSDESSPLQPEGTSEELEEIDKLYIRATSSHFNATFGDFSVDLDATDFARYSRRLQGVQGDVHFDEFSVNLAGAISRGEFRSYSFNGIEANQGPYQLHGEKGIDDIVVLAGTERVWLNGNLLKRGENNDYTIDYNAAQITFMPERTIKNTSRIVVDFEYTTQDYNRTFFQGEGIINPLQGVKIITTFLTLRDDRNSPIELSLSEDDLKALSDAGDNDDSAYVSGIDSVGAGNGNYDRVDSAGIIFFRYVTPDSGSYDINFSWVGGGNGDYNYEGDGIYRWVGYRQGSYMPLEYLPLPLKKEIFDLKLETQPLENVKLWGEIATSNYDRNLFSELDDDDNIGSAYSLGFNTGLDSIHLMDKNLGGIKWEGNYRKVERRFSPLGRLNNADYSEDWNLTGDDNEDEAKAELILIYRPSKLWNIRTSYGRLSTPKFLSIKKSGELNINNNRFIYGDLLLEHTDSWREGFAGYFRKARIELTSGTRKITPYFRFEREDQKKELSYSHYYNYNQYYVGSEINFAENWKQNLSMGFNKEQRYQEEPGLIPYGETVEICYSSSIFRILSLLYRYRNLIKEPMFNEPNLLSHTWRAESRYYSRDRAIGLNLYYQVMNKQASRMERIYTAVEEGEGDYRYDPDLDQYIPDTEGNYIVEKISTGDFEPVIETQFSLRNTLNPGNSKSINTLFIRILSQISSEFSLRGERISLNKSDISSYYIHPDNFLGDSTVNYGYFEVDERLYLFRRSRMSFDFRGRWKRSMDRKFVTGLEKNYNLLYSGEARYSFPALGGISCSFSNERLATTRGYAYYSDLDLFKKKAVLNVYYSGIRVLYASMEGGFSMEKNEYGDTTSVRRFVLAPEFRLNVWDGLLKGAFKWARVWSDPSDLILPYEMAEGDKTGVNIYWMVSYDWQFLANTAARIKYYAEKDPGIETLHYFEAEVRLSL